MPDDRTRLRLHQRLTELLDPELADAMMESMPPMPWNELATSSELFVVKTDVTELKTDVTELKTDVTELKTDVTELKTDVTELKTDVTELKTDVAGLGDRLHVLDVKFTDRFDAMDARITGQLEGLEGRLALRWMETTRLIVLAMMVLFVGVAGLAIRLGG